MPTSTDLYNAIARGDLERVKMIVKDGLTLTERHSYSCPLFQAAGLGHTEIVRYLLERGGLFIDGDDVTAFTPLMAACENGYSEVAALLVRHGADVNAMYEKEYESETGATCQEQGYPLTLATVGGHVGIVRMLLENGADPENFRFNYDGQWNSEKTPLFLAIQRKNLDLAAVLVAHRADPNAKCLVAGESCTALTYSMAKANQEAVKWLLDHGAILLPED